MTMFLPCRMRLFPLILAIWNIERHNAFAQGIQWLLRESTNTEILIECFLFFFPAIWPIAEWKHDSIISWPAQGLIWWARSTCIWLTDFFRLLQKAGSTFKYKSPIVYAESLFKKTTGRRGKQSHAVKGMRALRG